MQPEGAALVDGGDLLGVVGRGAGNKGGLFRVEVHDGMALGVLVHLVLLVGEGGIEGHVGTVGAPEGEQGLNAAQGVRAVYKQ